MLHLTTGVENEINTRETICPLAPSLPHARTKNTHTQKNVIHINFLEPRSTYAYEENKERRYHSRQPSPSPTSYPETNSEVLFKCIDFCQNPFFSLLHSMKKDKKRAKIRLNGRTTSSSAPLCCVSLILAGPNTKRSFSHRGGCCCLSQNTSPMLLRKYLLL